ncbi:SUN domain-containing protein 1 isoform X19 [Monodelphis domestica]|uniref:SUN domain-containing protein 1 isoform X19 n=2 Tax=Monodelphis domestica TaxID=13616 RepID=UPI0024E242E0|nr:SUN domain-containing protein 1 isoform X19 [Monodelphis domestica]XP_056660314.1 SUN domain-containing protein 1 isoform X19 [Monodelphis domestica]
MDFSRLHTYTPPQCVPENTGYTYALSSSYSSDALDFETEHKLDPVFDSPRMSRRSLRLVTTAYTSDDGQVENTHSYTRNTAYKDKISKTSKQHRNTNKQSLAITRTPRKATSSSSLLSQSTSHASDASLRSSVLDESLIREQTKVDHFWGLDDDGDLKGGTKNVIQGNGDLATGGTDTTLVNGYTCTDCSMLSERKDVLTAYSTSHVPSSRIYSRERSQKPHSNYCGSMNVKEFLREDGHLSVNGESLCYFLMQTLQRIGATGWFVSKKVLSFLWLAIVSPGKAASGVFWWLGTGWYQFVTLISWLNVFLLTRCLPKICKLLLLLIPLLLLLGIGLYLWNMESFLSLLPIFNWTTIHRTPKIDESRYFFKPDSSLVNQPVEGDVKFFDWHRIGEIERQMALLSDRCHNSDEDYGKVTLLLQKLQAKVDQMDDDSGTLSLIKNVVGQHLKEMKSDSISSSKTDFLAFHQEHELRILKLEDLLGKLSEKSKIIQEELDQTKSRTFSGIDEQQHLLSKVKHLEMELGHLKSELLTWQGLKTSCAKVETMHEKVDTQIRETIKLMFSGDQQDGSLEWLLQWLSSKFVSKGDLQILLRDLELQILKNITHHMSMTKEIPSSETVVNAVNSLGISGITEAQAHAIVNNALKLYSQDKTGMVDFALESGGGSILSTRCSETYETKTALISLFGIPLWYFSQSPRVVIQPDIYPGNCWAFKGSQGYLVVRLSMMIHPTAFTIEHIPKTLSPTGNITSAPKDFSVYGLDNEYQEEGMLLGQFVYNQEGESLQMFHAMKSPGKAFQIVELRILSNWGHPEYTCLYRFRVHGEPIK